MITEFIKVPPQALDIEESVLASCFLGHTDQVVNLISPTDFYRSAHQKIFQAVLDLHEKKEPVDLGTVYNFLKTKNQAEEVGGAMYLSNMIDTTPLAANIESYCKILKEKSILRQLIKKSSDIINKCFETGGEEISLILEQSHQAISSVNYDSGSDVNSFHDLSTDAGERYEKIYNAKNKITGISSGFYDLDWFTCGFQPSDLILLAARPSMGKTSLASNIANNVSDNGDPVLIFSHEMSKEQLFDRQIASDSGVNLQKFRSGKFETEDWGRITTSLSKAFALPVYIEDSSALHYSEIRQKIYSTQKKYGIKLVIFDYLQLARGDKERTRDREIASISAAFKAMAKDFNIPVIVLSQLNRSLENRTDKRPKISDLRDSGTLEQDADLIMFLYRPVVYKAKEDYEGHTELNIAKHRNGPTGMVKLIWQDKFTRFLNRSRDYE